MAIRKRKSKRVSPPMLRGPEVSVTVIYAGLDAQYERALLDRAEGLATAQCQVEHSGSGAWVGPKPQRDTGWTFRGPVALKQARRFADFAVGPITYCFTYCYGLDGKKAPSSECRRVKGCRVEIRHEVCDVVRYRKPV